MRLTLCVDETAEVRVDRNQAPAFTRGRGEDRTISGIRSSIASFRNIVSLGAKCFREAVARAAIDEEPQCPKS